MITIKSGINSPIVLINTFTVAPENQDELIRVLNEATENVIKKIPGFISASIHRGKNGDKVANYAQWRDEASFESMLQNPEARMHMRLAGRLAIKFEPNFYDVEECHEKLLEESGEVFRY
jgi:heme-degrading monooxygenase HmoA